ncbi:calcium-binding protein [Paracoccus nototheniae]
MADTGPSHILSLDIPSVLDLRRGQLDAIFAASVQDPDGVRQVVVYYDRPLATQAGSYDFQIIHGWGNDWTDGRHSYTASVLPHNVGGPLNITHVVIEDNEGNRTTVSAQALRDLGVDTSIAVRSSDPDVTAPVLTELVLPDRIDVRNGHATAEFSAAGRDQNEIAQVNIWFDRDLSYSFGTGNGASFNEFSLAGLYGYMGDDWSDGRSTRALLVSQSNPSGLVMIDRVDITDVYGNRSTYTNADLRRLGFDTSIDVIGAAAPTPATYVAEFPDVITLREGQTLQMPLQFVGMTNHWVYYEYSVSADGGTASGSDIGASSGTGWVSVSSTSPSDRTVLVPISANRDDVAEPTETAYLTVRLTGNLTFEDGGTLRVVRIDILDDNRTIGGNGGDTLYGTPAAETLAGGRGDDRYFVTPGDLVVELANGGTDTVVAGSSFVLTPHVENLVMTGAGHINGTGNGLANRLIGNAGNNTLDGGLGADTMEGGIGNDTYIVDNFGDRVIEAANAGTDRVRASVSHALSAHVENLVLTGTAHVNATGNAQANYLFGNAGNNILNGGFGADTMEGGAGNDTYLVDNIGDRIVERANGGTDTARSAISHSLTAHVENLILTGNGHVNGTGNSQSNALTGTTGNNVLDGGQGADTMSGGRGNDLYIVDNAGDRVVEVLHSGIDTVQASVSHALSANVENLTLTGAAHLNGTGNALANRLNGNSGNNNLGGGQGADTVAGGDGNDTLRGEGGNDTLFGGAGHDRLLGGAGKDQLTGGLGADHFIFASHLESGAVAAARDVITDYNRSQGDRIDLTMIDANARLTGDQSFDFVGTAAFSGAAGEVRYQQANGTTLIYADIDGDRRADFAVELSRQIALVEHDFLL